MAGSPSPPAVHGGVEIRPASAPGAAEAASRLSIAPMMDRTDRHYRYFMRQLTRHTLLYSEMVTTQAVLHGDVERLLAFHPAERPLALQLGGSVPTDLARCASLAADLGYDEINLNVGCPSDRVQKGNLGACLMEQPELVADCVRAMCERVTVPVTVKHRIGTDRCDRHEDLRRFVSELARAGCKRFIVHARIAVLSGLSPKENRSVPPLDHARVHQLKRDFPDCTIVINGGISTLEQAERHLDRVDGAMIGRAAYDDPFLFSPADQRIFQTAQPGPTREQVIRAMLPYLEQLLSRGEPLHRATRHMHGLFAGRPGARRWRRALSEGRLDLLVRAANPVDPSPEATRPQIGTRPSRPSF